MSARYSLETVCTCKNVALDNQLAVRISETNVDCFFIWGIAHPMAIETSNTASPIVSFRNRGWNPNRKNMGQVGPVRIRPNHTMIRIPTKEEDCPSSKMVFQ